MTALLLAAAGFVAMEPVTYAVHRWVMHGVGTRFHRSHHRRWPTRREGEPWWEGNEVFPLAFAAIRRTGA